MNIYNREDGIKIMNRMTKSNKSFVFIIDYNVENVIVEDVDKIDSEELLFSFNGYGNCNFSNDLIDKNIDFSCNMPPYNNYRKSFGIIVDNINRGNSYLANLTCRVPIQSQLSTKDIFIHSKSPYKLWLKDRFVCFSPEIFVRIDNAGSISSYPMKGTIDASILNAEKILMEDKKESAEHATIVDLIRNDLSMVSSNVRVEKYRYIDEIETNKGRILQTSSKITGRLPENYCDHIGDIITKLLPAGSITGAPKEKTMQIIEEAEGYERKFYTGIMGCYKDKCLDSAVMIRFIDEEDGHLFFKAGGGITSLSDCKSEYKEIEQKIYVPIY